MLLIEGPSRLPVRAAWPLHQSLAALREEAALSGITDRLPLMTFKADAVVGVIEENAVIGVHQLLADGILCLVGQGWEATLKVVEETRTMITRPPLARVLPGFRERAETAMEVCVEVVSPKLSKEGVTRPAV